jgi:hypothetical protein
MTLSAAQGREFKEGDQPEFELRAVNTLKQPAQVAVCVIVTATTPGGLMSRIGPMPSVLWQDQVDLALKPNETRVLNLATRTKLPAKSSISVSLSQVGDPGKAGNPSLAPLAPNGQPGIVSMRFSTVPRPPTPTPTPALADATAARVAATPALR